MVNEVNRIFNMDALTQRLTVEFCERLKEADWSCNVTNLSDEDFEIAFTQWSRRVRNMTSISRRVRNMTSRGEEE